jgi:hypothetical protein
MEFKWTILKLVVIPQQVDKSNVVVQAEWFCTATDEVNNLQAAASGKKNFSLSDSFIGFNELSESQVLDWCFAPETIKNVNPFDSTTTTVTKMLKDEVETQVAEQISRKLSQKVSQPVLPWVA